MKKYVEEVKIDENVFVLYQFLELIDTRYGGSFPKEIEDELSKLIELILKYIEPIDRFDKVDIKDSILIHRYIYDKEELKEAGYEVD